MRTVDTAARLGGDEFTVVLEKVQTAAGPRGHGRLLGDCWTTSAGRPYIIDGVEAQLSVSVGVSQFPADARTSEIS